MKEILFILDFSIFLKLFLFWLWLWQLKEYHLGRFLAHFQEGQAVKKILSSLWRLKYPKFTKKILIILFVGLFLSTFAILNEYYLSVYLLIIFVPLFFQIITVIWRKGYLVKARKKREKFKNLLAIGITGSYGKTSTKEFLYAILNSKFPNKILKTKEHQNSEVGISQCILNNLRPEHEIFICEMGAYNRGGIKLLCDIIKPKIGILTGINEQHMATFGSQENIIKAKYELIESLPQDGIAFFNGKNKYCLDLYNKTNVEKYLYGQNASFFGEENILGAMTVAEKLGMTKEEIKLAVGRIDNKMPGVSIKKGINGLTIIDATYSANPDGVMANLEYLKKFSEKKIIVMPCLIELGSASKEVHQRIGKKIAEVCDLAIITTKDRFKEIKDGVKAKQSSKETRLQNILLLENPQKIFEKITSFAREGAILLESRVSVKLIRLLNV